MNSVFILLFLLSVVALIAGLIRPSLFYKIKITSRKKVTAIFSILIFLFLILDGATLPKANTENNLHNEKPLVKITATQEPSPIKENTPSIMPTRENSATQISINGYGATISDWNKKHT